MTMYDDEQDGQNCTDELVSVCCILYTVFLRLRLTVLHAEVKRTLMERSSIAFAYTSTTHKDAHLACQVVVLSYYSCFSSCQNSGTTKTDILPWYRYAFRSLTHSTVGAEMEGP